MRTEVSQLGHFLFKLAVLLLLVAIVTAFLVARKRGLDLLTVIICLALFIPSIACWLTGFLHDYNRILRGELHWERHPEFSAMAGKGATNPSFDLIQYSRTYLSQHRAMSVEEAWIAILDPDLGPEMDRLMTAENPCDQLDAIHEVLDRAAANFREREPDIRQYLRTMGHPFGTKGYERQGGP